ncbi:ATP-binding protein [Catellatospora coxensis]|uniref:ATP-binding protein n=1 Tax=Catellatospora coxensis TaxID=310354 RepID=UPI0019431D9D|nr:ATP-binding protein [Catellatospora coxensis]
MIEAPAGSGRTTFLRQLVDILSDEGVVAIELNEWDLSGTAVVQAATDAFRRLMARAGVDAPLVRTMELLARRREIVVLVDGIDSSPHAARRATAVDTTRRRLEELGAARLAHVVIVDANSTPPELLRSRLRLTPIGSDALARLVAGTAAVALEGFHTPSRRLGSQLAHLRLGLHTLRAMADEVRQAARDEEALLVALHEHIAADGPTALLMRRLHAVGLLPQTSPGPGIDDRSMAGETLGQILEFLLLGDGTQVPWTEVVARLDWSRIDEFMLGLAELERKVIVERREHAGDLVIRFLDPELRELAVGMRLAMSRNAFRHSGARGGGAFAGELIQRTLMADGIAERDLVWRQAYEVALRNGYLSAMGDADRAIRALGEEPPMLTAGQLERLWEKADDFDRTMYVNRLPQVLTAIALDLLWSRLRSPLFNRTSHELRRDIAAAICGRGDLAWRRLHQSWEKHVRAAESGDLAWQGRRGAVWGEHGNAAASLCWILPTVAVTATGGVAAKVQRLLDRLVAATVPGGDLATNGRPDLGIEISLAEGLKDAAHHAMSASRLLPDPVWSSIALTAAAATSWVSRLLALQAALLATAGDPARRDAFSVLVAQQVDDRHPITASYARLLRDFVGLGHEPLSRHVYAVVWVDDTDALAAAGDDLDDRAARTLAAVTLVLNLVEARLRVIEAGQTGTQLRVRALSADAVPGCLRSRVMAYGAESGRCGCDLGLCGPELSIRAVRRVSEPFAHRCLAGRPDDLLIYDGALDVHLRRLIRP